MAKPKRSKAGTYEEGQILNVVSGELFYKSKARPLVVFDPEGPFDAVDTIPSHREVYDCPVCEDTVQLFWYSGPDKGDLGLIECLGCGVVSYPGADIR